MNFLLKLLIISHIVLQYTVCMEDSLKKTPIKLEYTYCVKNQAPIKKIKKTDHTTQQKKIKKAVSRTKKLLDAVLCNNPKKVANLLGKNVNPNQADADGVTLLMHAVANNPDVSIARLLLEHGADVSPVDNEGRSVHNHAFERYMFSSEPVIVQNPRWFLRARLLENVIEVDPYDPDVLASYVQETYDYCQFDEQAVFLFEQLYLFMRFDTNNIDTTDQYTPEQ